MGIATEITTTLLPSTQVIAKAEDWIAGLSVQPLHFRPSIGYNS